MLLDTRCYVTSATMTETAGVGDYTLDTDILKVIAWSWANGTTTSDPERVSPDEILRLRAADGTSSAVTAAKYAVAGSNLLMVWPTPAAADTITIYHVPRPTEMSSASHDPATATYGGIPVEYHDAIEFHALWRLASYDDDQSSGQGERYRQLYDDEVRRIRRDVYALGGKPGRAIVNRRRQTLRPHNNAQDIR